MKIEDILAESVWSILIHGIYVLLITLLTIMHPDYLAYVAVFFAATTLVLTIRSHRIKRQQIHEHEVRSIAEGKRYKGGEIEALSDIRQDIRSLVAGSSVTVCGTGVTAIAGMPDDVYEALRRGVNFEVFVLHPDDTIVERLADWEPELAKVVVQPMIEDLRHKELTRKLLGAEWCDKAVDVLSTGDGPCPLHPNGHTAHSPHARVICTSAMIWKQVVTQLKSNDPESIHGQVLLHGYRWIPIIKAWRLRLNHTTEWFYLSDHLYYPGVGIDNPMRRVHKPIKDPEVSLPGLLPINIKNLEAQLERIRNVSTTLYPDGLG